jgi:hypothetical protein
MIENNGPFRLREAAAAARMDVGLPLK